MKHIFMLLALISLSNNLLESTPPTPEKGNNDSVATPQHPGYDKPGLPVVVESDIEGYPYVQYRVEETSRADSGYEALKNGYLSVKLTESSLITPNEKIDFLSPVLRKQYYSTEQGPWRERVIKKRYSRMRDELLLKPLAYHIARNGDTEKQDAFARDMKALAPLLSKALDSVVEQATKSQASQKITEKLIVDGVTKEIDVQKATTPLTREKIGAYLKGLDATKMTLEVTKNKALYKEAGTAVKTVQYGPSDDTTSLRGSWLSESDIIELDLTAAQENMIPSKSINLLVECINSTKPNDVLIACNNLYHDCKKEGNFLNLHFILCENNEWITCLIKKEGGVLSFTVTDTLNKDRRQEPTIIKLSKAIKEGLTNPSPDQKPLLGNTPRGSTKPGDKDEDAALNYDSPMQGVPTSELPTLQQIFGGKIPNRVKGLINRLKRKELNPEHASTSLKNAVLLYGPPGTGKTTAAEVIARELGWVVVFAGGGDFRTAYQGSGKAKIDALFAEAVKRSKQANKPVMVIIDEIDGMASQIKEFGHNQEDSRSMKALITTLDQYRYEPNLFIIGTSNYPERLDPAVRRRFDAMKIPLPDYGMRKHVIQHYLKRNKIEIKENDPEAITPYFFGRLVSATRGFSPDAIGNMINTAAFDAREEKLAQTAQNELNNDNKKTRTESTDFKPENRIPMGFRFQFNIREKSLMANTFELLTLPLIPIFHLTDESKIAHHIYSQYRVQAKVMSEMKIDEASNHPLYRYEKFGDEPMFWVKDTQMKATDIAHNSVSQFIVTGLTAGGLYALKYCWDKMKTTYEERTSPDKAKKNRETVKEFEDRN